MPNHSDTTTRRGLAREEAILKATLVLLAQKGYEAMTIDAIAAQARASKATIYRRWTGKAELVKAALDAQYQSRLPEIPDTGSLRTDLLAALEDLQAQASEANLLAMYSLFSAMRYDAHLAKVLQEHILNDDLTPFEPVIRRAVARGELVQAWAQKALSLIHEVGEALVLRRLSIGLAIDPDFARHLVDNILLPLLSSLAPENSPVRRPT